MIRLKAPLEMGICVESPETMIGFYREELGFEMIRDLRVPAEKSSPAGFSQTRPSFSPTASKKSRRSYTFTSGKSLSDLHRRRPQDHG